ncbi:MAG: hypothetical protein AAFV43_06265 [Planctomycetota bacterium]
MRNALIIAVALAATSAEADWVFAPSHFTHNPYTGQRVAQYAQPAPVEPLPDPRDTVSRYWRTRTNLRGVDGSVDTIYDVRSFGTAQGGFDAQRERGFDAQLETLRGLEPFRNNPYLFFGGLQGFGYGFPGYSAPTPGAGGVGGPGGWGGAPAAVPGYPTNQRPAQAAPCSCAHCGHCRNAATAPNPAVGQPGSAYPYAPPQSIVAPLPYFGFPYGGLPLGGFPPYAFPHGGMRPPTMQP